MEKYINPGDRVRISDNAKEDSDATNPEHFTKSKHAGKEGEYIGDIIEGEVVFSIIKFDDGIQDLIRKQYVDPL